MDLRFIKNQGKKNKLLKPIRSLLWRLISPYFVGLDVELKKSLSAIVQEKDSVPGPGESVSAVESRIAKLENETLAHVSFLNQRIDMLLDRIDELEAYYWIQRRG